MTVSAPLVLLFTDFGTDGPYLGQMEAAVLAESLQSRVVNLISDAPRCDPRRAAYLLGALTMCMPPGCVVVAVVDPGVGGARDPLIAEVDGRVFLAPDNGLLSQVVATGSDVRVGRIDWRPERLSNSFHGRDLFAPVAGFLSRGQGVEHTEIAADQLVGHDWSRELAEVIYTDVFGNGMTGIRAAGVDVSRDIALNGTLVSHASTFSTVMPGQAFWYENSCGLLEIAVNQGNAARELGLDCGTAVSISAA